MIRIQNKCINVPCVSLKYKKEMVVACNLGLEYVGSLVEYKEQLYFFNGTKYNLEFMSMRQMDCYLNPIKNKLLFKLVR